MKLVSFDLKADFAFFRKPDTNNTINLSYNIIHKPALLGILGAILGLEGYREKGKLPAYYEILKDIKVGIEPLQHDNGNYSKTVIKYTNTVGYANGGANFLTEELTLLAPAYRIYLLLDVNIEAHMQLDQYLKQGYAEYLPYFGKNEHTAWWEATSYCDYRFGHDVADPEEVYIRSIFQKQQVLKDNSEAPFPDLFNVQAIEDPFLYFERLPLGFDLTLLQYEMGDFAYSNYRIKNAHQLENLVFLEAFNTYVQLF